MPFTDRNQEENNLLLSTTTTDESESQGRKNNITRGRTQLENVTPKRPPTRRANFSVSSMKKTKRNTGRTLTPPRSLIVGCPSSSVKPSKRPSGINHFTLSPCMKDASKYEIRTSELDPSTFQVDLPSYEEIISHAKLCSIVDSYTEVEGRDFDFSSLMPWKVVDKVTVQDCFGLIADSPVPTKKSHQSCLLKKLKEAIEDIIVEGFFREYFEDKIAQEGLGRIEACIFSSDKLRQFIVCYRGSSDVQCRPVHGNSTKIVENSKLKETLNNLDENVFNLLNRLSILKPFCDVVMIGHSFGAMLSTMGAKHYATDHPVMRIACHLFGSPRVGDLEFRNSVHSLPNLKVVRVERRSDPFVLLPEGAQWSHVGHSIVINTQPSSFPACDEDKTISVHAYRFDKYRPSNTFVKLVKDSVCSLSQLGRQKIGNEMASYLKDLEKIQSYKVPWLSEFEGETGTGIFGQDQEVRRLV